MIALKPKKCKGEGRAKGHPGCGTITPYRKYGLCKANCYPDWLLNTDDGKIVLEKSALRGKKIAKKERSKQSREQREAMKSISRLIMDARIPFQKWIKLRDINKACISCGTVDSKIWHAGHYLKAEVFTGLIFDELNCNKQCGKCNTYLGGNETGYRKGLVERYGEAVVVTLEVEADLARVKKFDRDELRDIKKKYQQKIKDFK